MVQRAKDFKGYAAVGDAPLLPNEVDDDTLAHARKCAIARVKNNQTAEAKKRRVTKRIAPRRAMNLKGMPSHLDIKLCTVHRQACQRLLNNPRDEVHADNRHEALLHVVNDITKAGQRTTLATAHFVKVASHGRPSEYNTYIYTQYTWGHEPVDMKI